MSQIIDRPVTLIGITNQTRTCYVMFQDTHDEVSVIIKTNRAARELYTPLLSATLEERLIAVFLDHAGKRLGDRHWTGSRNMVPMHITEIARTALLLGADQVLMLHNHPTDEQPQPSQADMDSTAALGDALRIFNINLRDHIIISNTGLFCSIRRTMRERAGPPNNNTDPFQAVLDRILGITTLGELNQ